MEETPAEAKAKTMHLRVPANLHSRIADYARATHRSHHGAALALIDTALEFERRQEVAKSISDSLESG